MFERFNELQIMLCVKFKILRDLREKSYLSLVTIYLLLRCYWPRAMLTSISLVKNYRINCQKRVIIHKTSEAGK